MSAYYNDNDPFCAAWLRNLILSGAIAPGEVDERPIEDVRPGDLAGFKQCHFFAGIGGWSYALRLAGWPDDQPVWTGSCPCQPFSVAGKRAGHADSRHLWPEFSRLIGECSPPVVFGEQVASAAGREWLSGVRSDLEALGYAVGAADLCAAGIGEEVWTEILYINGEVKWSGWLKSGPPHIRQRLWWVADHSRDGRREECPVARRITEGNREEGRSPGSLPSGTVGGLADNLRPRLEERGSNGRIQPETLGTLPGEAVERGCDSSRLDNSPDARLTGERLSGSDLTPWNEARLPESSGRSSLNTCGLALSQRHAGESRRLAGESTKGTRENRARAYPQSGRPSVFSPWSSFSLIPCLDGKTRRIEPGTFPLANGVPNRVGKLRGFGNSIVPQVATEFIQAFLTVQAEAL